MTKTIGSFEIKTGSVECYYGRYPAALIHDINDENGDNDMILLDIRKGDVDEAEDYVIDFWMSDFTRATAEPWFLNTFTEGNW